MPGAWEQKAQEGRLFLQLLDRSGVTPPQHYGEKELFSVFMQIKKCVITSEREARSEFFCCVSEKSEYARPDPTQPYPTP